MAPQMNLHRTLQDRIISLKRVVIFFLKHEGIMEKTDSQFPKEGPFSLKIENFGCIFFSAL